MERLLFVIPHNHIFYSILSFQDGFCMCFGLTDLSLSISVPYLEYGEIMKPDSRGFEEQME